MDSSEGSIYGNTNIANTQDTTAAKLLKYFIDVTPVAEDEFSRNQFIIAKENQVYQGSNECLN